MDTDARAFVGGELAEDLVIEVHECREQSARRIELEREPGFGEVDLGARTPGDDPAQLVRCLRDQVVDERLARVAVDPVARVHQADRRGRDDRLLEWRARLVARAVEIRVRLGRVAERGRREDRQLPGMSVLEGDGHATGGQREASHGIRREARLALLTIGDDRRTSHLEPLERVADRVVEQRVELVLAQAPLGGCLHARL